MQAVEIKNGVYYVGVLNPDLRTFDIIMTTEFGTSYNSYLVKGEKTAIIEAVKTNFAEEFLRNIESVVSLKDVNYIILNHTEPDHSGALKFLLEKAPHIQVVTSRAGHQYIKAIVNRDFKYKVVNDGDEIDLGGGKRLKFFIAPFLHWPDTMFTYLEEDAVLFPCDVFGCHYSEDHVFDDGIRSRRDYEKAFRYYFDVIMSPFKEYVLKGLDKIKDLRIDIIAPSHGPVLRQNVKDPILLYDQWSRDIFNRNDPPKVLITYVSAYGCTERLAVELEKAVKDQGLDVERIDAEGTDLFAIKEKMEKADGLLFGSPTINRDAVKPIWDVLSMVDAIKNRGKLCGAFGSYGWGGESVKMMEDRLKGLRLNVVEPGVKANLVPSEEELKKAYEYGGDFAQRLKK